jgi:Epoxide hydrolase N terminus
VTKKSSSLCRGLLAATALAFGLPLIAAQATPATAADETAIHPFHYHASDSSLADLRKRIANTRWPDKETVSDRSQGNQLATLQEIIHYWGTKATTRFHQSCCWFSQYLAVCRACAAGDNAAGWVPQQ